MEGGGGGVTLMRITADAVVIGVGLGVSEGVVIGVFSLLPLRRLARGAGLDGERGIVER